MSDQKESKWLKRDRVAQLRSGYWIVSYQETLDIFTLHGVDKVIPNHEELCEIIQELCKTYDSLSEIEIADHNQSILGAQSNIAGVASTKVRNVAKPTKTPAAGFIYLIWIKGSDNYKIGLSIDPQQRLGHLQTCSPYAMDLIHSIAVKDMIQVEMFLHEKYKAKRTRGEWFTLSLEEVTEFCSYKEGDL